MDASNVTMQTRPAYEVRFAKSASNGPRIPSRLVVHAVVQPAVHGQIHPSAICFVQVVVMNGENVAVFQISEAAIITPEQFLRTSYFRNFVPDVRVASAVLLTFPRLVAPEKASRVIVRNQLHSRHKVA
jgi:hypothetical protein